MFILVTTAFRLLLFVYVPELTAVLQRTLWQNMLRDHHFLRVLSLVIHWLCCESQNCFNLLTCVRKGEFPMKIDLSFKTKKNTKDRNKANTLGAIRDGRSTWLETNECKDDLSVEANYIFHSLWWLIVLSGYWVFFFFFLFFFWILKWGFNVWANILAF